MECSVTNASQMRSFTLFIQRGKSRKKVIFLLDFTCVFLLIFVI